MTDNPASRSAKAHVARSNLYRQHHRKNSYPNTKALYALVLAALAVAAFGFYSLLAILRDPLL